MISSWVYNSLLAYVAEICVLMSDNHSIPWSDTVYRGVWSGYAMFAKACL